MMGSTIQDHANNHADSPLGLLRRLGLAQVLRHLLRQTRHEQQSRPLRSRKRHALRETPHEHETQSEEDADVYLKAISYIGVMYKGIREGFDSAHATARRILAMPSLLDDRWMELLEERRPRALAILIHAFACGELIAGQNFWFRGIAERQIPGLCDRLPPAWRPMVAWPLRVAGGAMDSEPVETRVDVEEL
jgi:hypothetical protein